MPSGNFQKHGHHIDAESLKEMALVTKGRIPGYTGFIRGSQHIAGATYGSTTRSAQLSYGSYPKFQEINEAVELPTAPHKKAHAHAPPKHQIPGYCGYLTHARDHFGETYGKTTRQTGKTWGNTRVFDTAGNNWDQSMALTMPDSFSLDAESFRGSRSNNKPKKRCEPPGQKPAVPTPKAYKGASIKEPFVHMRQKKEGLVPGYCGFVPHSQHVQGLTFGATTRTTQAPSNLKKAWGGSSSMLPLEPHRTSSPTKYAQNTAAGGTRHHLPGYTGFLQGARHKYGNTYGSTTAKLHETQPTGWFSRDYQHPQPNHLRNDR